MQRRFDLLRQRFGEARRDDLGAAQARFAHMPHLPALDPDQGRGQAEGRRRWSSSAWTHAGSVGVGRDETGEGAASGMLMAQTLLEHTPGRINATGKSFTYYCVKSRSRDSG